MLGPYTSYAYGLIQGGQTITAPLRIDKTRLWPVPLSSDIVSNVGKASKNGEATSPFLVS